MASWMVHLRVAEVLLEQISGLSETEFIVGNIAPDSGVPNEDWSVFTPSTDQSHFKLICENGKKEISVDGFIAKYFTKEMQKSYTKEQFSFYLGYLTHLLTDILWVELVFPICKAKNPELYSSDKKTAIWTWKKDFYDLDALYIRENPDFRSYQVYKGAVGFVNDYMDIFASDAMDNRREYIVSFYEEAKKENDLDRDYEFFTERDMSDFILAASKKIKDQLTKYIEFM